MKKWRYILCAFAIGALFLACDNGVAGGVTEETNSIAGVIQVADKKAAKGVEVLARAVANPDIVFKDTTDGDGQFAFQFKEQGLYGITAKTEGLIYYEVVDYKGVTVKVEGALKEFTSISGTVQLSGDKYDKPIQLSIPGSSWSTQTTASGYFEIDSVPVGSYYVHVHSPDLSRYNDADFWVSLSTNDLAFSQGPLPVSSDMLAPSETVGLMQSESVTNVTVWGVPLSVEYGLVGWWPMTYIAQESPSLRYLSDARGRTDVGVVYGKAFLDSGVLGTSIVLRGPNDFVVIESDRGVLDSAKGFTLEAWVYIEDLNEVAEVDSYRKNIIGKVGFGGADDHSLFSLALIKNECGVANKPSLAFFIADGSGMALDCENAAIATEAVQVGKWIYTTAVWDGSSVSLYLNGIHVASKPTSVNVWLPSIESLYFGKENLNLKLDEIRWSTVGISSSDVLYRYYNQGGVQ